MDHLKFVNPPLKTTGTLVQHKKKLPAVNWPISSKSGVLDLNFKLARLN